MSDFKPSSGCGIITLIYVSEGSAIVSKISVIVPVYNTEEYLDECVNSLLAQTHKNIEIILINNGSNDACTKKLETFQQASDRIQVIHFAENKGVGAARNYGIRQATGDFIYFMDSDDYIPEKTLEILIGHIQGNAMIRGRMKTTHFAKSFAILFERQYDVNIHTEDKYRFINNKSALNFLFRKDFVLKNKLTFAEDVDLYSDLQFMIPALIHVDYLPHVAEALYFKRRRNAPILNPSLIQGDEVQRISDYIRVYIRLKNKYSDGLANVFLDQQFLNFYRQVIVTHFKNEEMVDLHFRDLSSAMKCVRKEILQSYDYVLKKEVHILQQENLTKYRRLNHRHQFLREAKDGLKSRPKFKKFVYKRFLNKLPVRQDWVFVESFQGRSYSDSPKYIYQYMLDNKMDFKYIWSISDKTAIPGDPVQAKRLTIRFFYYLAKSKYWIINSRLPNYIEKRDETVYLQTWHGTPLKRLAGDMEDVYMPGTNAEKYKRNFFNETQKWDYLVSPNAYSTEIFRRAFWFDGTFIESGYPRNDILYNKNTEEDIQQIKQKVGIPSDKKVILYAPTWRDDEYYGKGQYKFNLALDLLDMQKRLGDEYIILLRMHYFIASQMDVSHVEGFAFDVSSYEDTGELFLISDILITDYSSVFFDYANLKRPILFYTYDLEKYRESLRGFYIDIEKELPGPLLKTSDEVIDAIDNIEKIEENFRDRYEAFYNTYCLWDDGDASGKVVRTVFGE